MEQSQEGYTVSIKIYNSDKVVIIDEIDHPKVWDDFWYLEVSRNTYYAKSKHRRMHKLLCNGAVVDHRDRDGLNNTRANLRPCTHRQNIINGERNQGLDGSGYRGVARTRNKWQAYIQNPQGRKEYLGVFTSPEAAARVYDAKAREYHGEFAVLNFDAKKND